jgi:Ca2+-binding EF-hand superfamily protein
MRDYGVNITDEEVEAAANFFDTTKNEKISFDKFLLAILRQLSKRWLEMSHMAYKILDKSGDGLVTIYYIIEIYGPTIHLTLQANIKLWKQF